MQQHAVQGGVDGQVGAWLQGVARGRAMQAVLVSAHGMGDRWAEVQQWEESSRWAQPQAPAPALPAAVAVNRTRRGWARRASHVQLQAGRTCMGAVAPRSCCSCSGVTAGVTP